ncbi:DUF7573 domain-containing protein [Halocalculus aciditolerans]|uniref:DUF7573 domain-containing protein n=1 Tax=Halocalculus aciditolerans TaxID=1383812 RepID=UPI001666A7B3|nr:hypothetical protein [Halocalculus aciditolerans]
MTEDARLTEFEGEVSTPSPPAATYAFDPTGAPCEACGDRVPRRFRDENGLVCGDCKQWRV